MTPIAVVHLDESCLGNGREGENPGGGGGLVEARARSGRIERRDVFIHAPGTTNNRMALAGAIAVLEWIRRQWRHAHVTYVSDSEYLVRGMTEWLAGWKARGWTRKGGAIENLELWQKLDQAASAHTVSWRWVRGHAGHPKNEYADALAITAAQRQERSDGLRPSGFDAWLGAEQRAGRYGGYDPDKDIHDRA